MSVNKEIIKNEFVNASMLINKAKKAARETDMYLKNLNENILPRCQSAYITREIMKRDDIPSKFTQQTQNSLFNFKEQLDNNINKNNEKPIMAKTILKPKSSTSEKHSIHFNNYLENICEFNYSQQLKNSSTEIPELTKECKNNVGLVSFMAKAPVEKEINDCKLNNLSVQHIPRLDLKPDLVTQKLSNIQIKPHDKNMFSSNKPNVAYHEFTFELEQETCKCQLAVQQLPMSNIKARSQIHKVICGMLDNMSSNDPLSDELISQLQKIMIYLENTKSSEYSKLNELEDLVENYSVVGFNEIVIKNRLLEIAKNLIDNDHDVISFDQMSVEIENDSRQIIKRLDKIKKKILSKDHTMVLPNFSENNKHDSEQFVDRNNTNNHIKDISYSKDLYDIRSNTYISVGDFLRLSSHNITNSKIYKSSTVKDPKFALYSKKEHTIKNPNMLSNITAQNDLSNKNNLFQREKQLPKSKNHSQTTLLETVISSIPLLSSHPNRSVNTSLIQTKENIENNKIIDYTTSEYGTGSNKNTEISLECDQSKHQVNENDLNINYTPINNTIQDYENFKLNTQECHLNSSLFTSSSSSSFNSQHTNFELQVLDKETDSSCTNSMVIQEAEDNGSDTGSSISFGEVNHLQGFYKVDSNTSIGEINK